MEKTYSGYKLESRPGQLLIEHLVNTAQMCSSVKNLKMDFGTDIHHDAISDIAWIIGFSHDLGKATQWFQDYIHESDENKRALLKNRPETRHSLFSALFTYHMIKECPVFRAHSCHRLYRHLPVLAFSIVKKHHGNLRNLKDEIGSLIDHCNDLTDIHKQLAGIDADEFDRILGRCPFVKTDLASFADKIENIVCDNLLKKEKKSWRKYCKQGSLDVYFLFQLLYSALLSADKRDAIGVPEIVNNDEIASDLVDRYRTIRFGNVSKNRMDSIRNDIYERVCTAVDSINTDHHIFSLNVPTGTGKTLAGLSFALKLRARIIKHHGVRPRIIYTLPFLSVIDQNFDVFEDIFVKVTNSLPPSSVLLKHHHLAEIVYRTPHAEEYTTEESRHLIEGWESEIIVTTFMQLFHTLISNKNRMLRKFKAMANAIIILDEVQTIPYRYWHLVRMMFLKFAHIFNTRLILMTATQPLIFRESETVEIISTENKKRYFSALDRIDILNNSHEINTMEDFKSKLITDIQAYPADDFLIVLNTINCSIEIYNALREYLRNNEIDDLCYLSTNIIPKHRLERIQYIKTSEKRKLIVSTQLVEAGVDIDVDRVYRDFSPLDSLNQVAGRCNRNFSSAKKGVVKVFCLKDHKEFYRYIYGKGDLSIIKTKDILKKKSELSEKEFLKLGLEYFMALKDSKSNDTSEYLLEQLAKLNFYNVCEEKENRFALIDTDYPTVDLFIEIDAQASKAWQFYQEAIATKDPFIRKSKIDSIKKDLYSYVISVPAGKLCDLGSMEGAAFLFINKEQQPLIYDLETGFIRQSEIQYVF